jgi:replicative DNA helicase
MSNFDERTFLYALTARPEDARKFAVSFKPGWLHTTEYVPILAEIFAFVRKHGEQPSVPTLHEIFKDKDAEAYNLRYKDALNDIVTEIPDNSSMIYTLGQARDTGVVRDFQELNNSQTFLSKQADLKGSDILKTLHSFFNKHGDTSEDKSMDVREAIDYLVDNHGFSPELVRIPTGVHTIDQWCAGGLRTKQLGIIMAPTGDGKSTMLVVMAHLMATVESRKVWLVTNELSMEEQTERVLSRLTGEEVTKIIDDPSVGAVSPLLEKQWKGGLQDRLRLTEVNREVSVDDIEAEMMKWVNLIGWKPDVLVLDFIERMKPCDSGYSRDRVWDWIGAIARDLSRFAKRHNILVWTAAQTNRSGYAKDKGKQPLGLDMAQGSVKHLQEAAAIIGMRQEAINDDKIVMELADLKQRHSRRAHRSVYLECDLGRMSITNTVYDKDTCEVDDINETYDESPREQQVKRQQRKQRD